MNNWRYDYCKEAGYYLASWLRNGVPTVSELWFNPSTGWFAGRGYMSHYREGTSAVIRTVYAWMPLPEPADPTIAAREA